ncbi:hypothetical protein OG552_08060 [Streptomyces sp. NBC_01476]|uniref:hypothetical protein n=1 Tax=Streptomyces sp. NBC_01476 TaxID=2903881 RepID=UPI002E36F3ED|nr:hypothetical protein [Streptomyces sp. NBC_01476]
MTTDSAGAAFTAALVLLPFCAGLLVVKVCHLLVARRPFFSRDAYGPDRGVEVMAVSASVGLPAYAGGFLVGLDPDRAQAGCVRAAGAGPAGDLRLVEGWLPLSRACRWADGTTVELVPLWINVLVFTAAAGVLAGAVLAAGRGPGWWGRQLGSKRAAAR